MQLDQRITAALQLIGADIKALLAAKTGRASYTSSPASRDASGYAALAVATSADLYAIQATAPGTRVRGYRDSAARAADYSRAPGTDPTVVVLFDVALPNLATFTLDPVASWRALSPATLYLTVSNPADVTLSALVLEA